MHSPGNIFSILAFFLWVPIALWIARRWPPAKAASLLFLLPVMFLPERVFFKVPGLVALAKDQVAIICLLIGVLLFHRDRLRQLQLSKWIKLAILVLLGGNVVTMLLNSDPIDKGYIFILGHERYDAVHAVLSSTLNYVLPLVLGAAMFAGSKDLRVLFRTFVGAALVYALFQLIELRLSPQFHIWVYGFFQHSFRQMIRGGGFRPIVFMAHGLSAAMFTMVGVLAATALFKARITILRRSARWAMLFLWVVLVLSKSLAALLYTLIGVPLILFSTQKTQLRVAVALAVIVLSYPIMRDTGMVPVDEILETANSWFGEDRAGSLTTRFENEERLLERASERKFFGWGGYCRACVWDPNTGNKRSVSDGDWIITMGGFGLVGFLGKYLLLLLPVFMAARQLKYVPRRSDRRLLAALALIVGFSALDLLPNGNFNYLPFMFSGALMGCSAGMLRSAARHRRMKRERAMANQHDAELLGAAA